MGFSSILKKIEGAALTVLGFVHKEEPLVEGIIMPFLTPSAQAIINLVFKATNGAESLITSAEQGVAKKQAATAIVQSELPQLANLLSDLGVKSVVLSSESQNAISSAIDAGVALENSIANLVTILKGTVPPKTT